MIPLEAAIAVEKLKNIMIKNFYKINQWLGCDFEIAICL